MKRILVIGSPGAGKSTFSRRLGEKTGIEVIHLDRLAWEPNWIETDREIFHKRLEAALKGDSWIMDGNYGATLEMRIPACDSIIYLDRPRIVCVYNVLKRNLFYRDRRPDMPDECRERFDWEFIKFLKWIWDYPKRSKPRVEALLKRFENDKTIIRLRSNKEIENFFVNYFSDTVKSS